MPARKKRRTQPKGSSEKASAMDPADILGTDVLLRSLALLGVSDIANCALVSRAWASAAKSDLLWMPHCLALLEEKQHLALMDFADPETGMKAWWCRQKEASVEKELTTETLCSFTWTFRFKSFDPWWTKTADPMTRHFLPDGSLLGVPSHEPYWVPDAECRWRFTKSGNLPCGRRVRGQFLKVNHWPSLAISRTPDWGWRMENCWVVYTSNEPRHDVVLKEVLLKGRKGSA